VEEDTDEVWIAYTHFISMLKRQVKIEKFLNIDKSEESSGLLINYIYEPNPEEILVSLLPKYCLGLIQTSLFDAYASELAARVVAMQAASHNSIELIEHLTLVRNKIRQSSITKEMIEITSGAEGG